MPHDSKAPLFAFGSGLDLPSPGREKGIVRHKAVPVIVCPTDASAGARAAVAEAAALARSAPGNFTCFTYRANAPDRGPRPRSERKRSTP